MFPSVRGTSRYRQALVRRRRAAAALGIVAAASACGDGDAAVFNGAQLPPAQSTVVDNATAPSDTAISSETETDSAPATTDVTDTTVPAPVDATSTTVSGETTNAATGAFPAGGELLVEFTFSPTSTGEVIYNPYIAVWIEDADGNLVDTVSLWYQTEGRGRRWLRTLREWSATTEQVVDATSSGATRPAGTYTVAWDGNDAAGQPIAAGTYTLFVEAAREDGPYEPSSTIVDFNGTVFDVALPADGELFDLSARLVA